MPTLHRFGAVSVRMYADNHRPPHFHIVAPDFQVLVRISDLTVMAGEARPAQVAQARKAYTLDEAARALGLSRRMVAYYEKGDRPIPRVVALATRALEMAPPA